MRKHRQVNPSRPRRLRQTAQRDGPEPEAADFGGEEEPPATAGEEADPSSEGEALSTGEGTAADPGTGMLPAGVSIGEEEELGTG